MELMSVLDISGSALDYHRMRLEVIAANMANAQTTMSSSGGVYKPLEVVAYAQEPAEGELPASAGIRGYEVIESEVAPTMVYNPEHPEADDAGFIYMPTINPVNEMTNLITSTRLYEANIRVINAAKGMLQSALEIGES